ncbi:MAG: hypothetical protein JNM88_18965 [Chitinophagaceae bacterium]|nr:hypothetical protein [Chitinophagaceae bacterium]
MKKICFNVLGIYRLLLLAVLLLPFGALAQADTTKPETTTEPAAEEAAELISPSISFITIQKSDNTIALKASLKAKINGSLQKLHSLKVHFYIVSDSAEQEIGAVNADRNGEAIFNLKTEGLAAGSDDRYHFKTAVLANKSMEAAEEEVYIRKARLSLNPVKEDSLLTAQVKLVYDSAGTEVPVKEATIGIYVKRLFLPLKIGEGTTDENGEAAVEIPYNLPGDAKGNITLLARLDENETFGNLEAASMQPWGKAVSNKVEEQPRALWSSHPPMWMLITFLVLMGVVWGHYIVIVYQLFRLRKEQPVATDN